MTIEMATKSESAEIAVLQTQMEEVKGQIRDVKLSLDLGNKAQAESFKILSSKLDGVPYSLSAIEGRVTILEKRLSKSWVNNTLSAILGVVLTGLVSLIVFLIVGRVG